MESAWVRLAPDNERARRREGSLDRLSEWPAERALIGDVAVEPQLGQHDRRRFPHKQAWLDKHLGMIIFKLRPHANGHAGSP